MKRVALLSVLLFCSGLAMAQADIQKKLQTQLIMAEDGSVIEVDEGNFSIMASLSMEGKKNITIVGKGMDKTILSFKGQVDGAEGLRISNAENIVIKDLTIQDSKGDCIKTMNVKNITFQNVKTEWTGKPKASNGSYGLYPVKCEGVMIDGCVAIGASDAGIYVGQSKKIVVKNSKAINNVAGIEIENSLDAEVYDNEAYGNTGGILVFDLPDLVLKKGGRVKVYNNNVHDNNYINFAPKGNIVGKVPQGTGMLILATSDVEIFNNKITDNISIGVGVISYFMTESPIKDKEYDPYPSNIFIHDNAFQRKPGRATMKGRFGKMMRFKMKMGKDVPSVFWDGIVQKDSGDKVICLKSNQNGTFVNMDAANNFKNMSRDTTPHECTMKSL